MEAATPIILATSKPRMEEIDFIEELTINKENEKYIIKLGIKEDDLAIRVVPEKSKDMFYYQQCYSNFELQNYSMIFAMYKTMKDTILFLKKLKFEIEEKKEELFIKFNLYMPDGENKIVNFKLKQILLDNNHLIKYLLEENESIKVNISESKKEISNLKTEITNYQKEITNLKEENKKLWEEINNLKNLMLNSSPDEKTKISNFDSKIIDSISKIDFILKYIRQNDISFKFDSLKLLYRGSRDGDRTKTCHELCDNKQNVLIIMKSDIGYIFGGYSKIGFKTNNNQCEYKIDNSSILFSIDMKKIYPVIKDKAVICHIGDQYGLCFYNSLGFYDNFMNNNSNFVNNNCFKGFDNNYEINGNNHNFKCKELEVFQLL